MYSSGDIIDGKYRVLRLCSDSGGMGAILHVQAISNAPEYDRAGHLPVGAMLAVSSKACALIICLRANCFFDKAVFVLRNCNQRRR